MEENKKEEEGERELSNNTEKNRELKGVSRGEKKLEKLRGVRAEKQREPRREFE